MSAIPKVKQTYQGELVLRNFRRQTKDYVDKGYSLSRESFLTFVKKSDYHWLGQAGRSTVLPRLLRYAKSNLHEVRSWFKEAASIEAKPDFFLHPTDYFEKRGYRSMPVSSDIEEVTRLLDEYAELGLIPGPGANSNRPSNPQPETENNEPKTDRQPGPTKTHFPNQFNSIPEHVLQIRPDLDGKTREEAWLSDFDALVAQIEAKDKCLNLVLKYVTDAIDRYESLSDDSADRLAQWLRTIKKGVEETYNSKSDARYDYNPALACILHDSKREERARVLAVTQSLPTFPANLDSVDSVVFAAAPSVHDSQREERARVLAVIESLPRFHANLSSPVFAAAASSTGRMSKEQALEQALVVPHDMGRERMSLTDRHSALVSSDLADTLDSASAGPTADHGSTQGNISSASSRTVGNSYHRASVTSSTTERPEKRARRAGDDSRLSPVHGGPQTQTEVRRSTSADDEFLSLGEDDDFPRRNWPKRRTSGDASRSGRMRVGYSPPSDSSYEE